MTHFQKLRHHRHEFVPWKIIGKHLYIFIPACFVVVVVLAKIKGDKTGSRWCLKP